MEFINKDKARESVQELEEKVREYEKYAKIDMREVT